MAEEDKVREKILLALNEREKKAIEFMRQNGRLTMKEYIKLYPDFNRKTLTRDLNHLILCIVLILLGHFWDITMSQNLRDIYGVLLGQASSYEKGDIMKVRQNFKEEVDAVLKELNKVLSLLVKAESI